VDPHKLYEGVVETKYLSYNIDIANIILIRRDDRDGPSSYNIFRQHADQSLVIKRIKRKDSYQAFALISVLSPRGTDGPDSAAFLVLFYF